MATGKNPALSVYLGDDLMDRVNAAKEAGQFDPKELVKTALEQALTGERTPGPGDTAADLIELSKAAGVDLGEEGQPRFNRLYQRIQDLVGKSEGYDAQFAAMVDKLGGNITDWGPLFTRLDALLTAERQLQLQQAAGPSASELSSETQQAVVNNAFQAAHGTDFDLTWSDDEEQLNARIDNLVSQGGWPVSVSVAPDGRLLLLASWPQS